MRTEEVRRTLRVGDPVEYYDERLGKKISLGFVCRVEKDRFYVDLNDSEYNEPVYFRDKAVHFGVGNIDTTRHMAAVKVIPRKYEQVTAYKKYLEMQGVLAEAKKNVTIAWTKASVHGTEEEQLAYLDKKAEYKRLKRETKQARYDAFRSLGVVCDDEFEEKLAAKLDEFLPSDMAASAFIDETSTAKRRVTLAISRYTDVFHEEDVYAPKKSFVAPAYFNGKKMAPQYQQMPMYMEDLAKNAIHFVQSGYQEEERICAPDSGNCQEKTRIAFYNRIVKNALGKKRIERPELNVIVSGEEVTLGAAVYCKSYIEYLDKDYLTESDLDESLAKVEETFKGFSKAVQKVKE